MTYPNDNEDVYFVLTGCLLSCILGGAAIYCALWGFAIMVIVQMASPWCHGAEPSYKSTLRIAFHDDPQDVPSRMLRAELERNWLQPNPAIQLTAQQKDELLTIGTEMTKLQRQIRDEFDIRYVPRPFGVHAPAVCVNGGRWEMLPPQAFLREKRPLQTLNWYRKRHVAIRADSQASTGYHKETWGHVTLQVINAPQGFSGEIEPEIPPPWEPESPPPVTRGSSWRDPSFIPFAIH